MCDEKLFEEGEVDIFDFLRVIYKYKNIIVVIAFISVCLCAGNIMMQPSRYLATATFFPLNVKQYKLSSQEPPELRSKLVLEDLIISILNSRGMADKIISDLDLKNVWRKELLEDTRQALKKSTSISLAKSGVINLNVITENGELSAKIANIYIDNLENFNRELQLSTDISVVQVIDHAVSPERSMPRGLIKKSISTGILSIFITVLLSFVLEYIKIGGFKEKIKALGERVNG